VIGVPLKDELLFLDKVKDSHSIEMKKLEG
jgi:hypothetical protein